MIRVLNNSSDLSTWYYKPAVSNGDGTKDNPFNWLEESTDGGTSINCNLVNSGDHNWYIFSLTGGTTYNFTSYSNSYPVSIRIYLQSDPDTVLADRQYTGSGSSSFSFVPSTSDLYLFEMYSDPIACSSCTGTSPATISPIPNEISAEGGYEKKLIDMSTGIDDVGYLFNYQDLVDSDLLHKTIPTDGLVFYAPLSKDINTTTGHTLIDNGGVAFGSIDGIDASLFIGSKNLSFTQSNFPKNKESFTFSGWFYLLSNPSGERMIMGWGGDGARTYFIPFINGNKFQCSRDSGDWFVNAYTFDYNRWYHVLITHETPNMKVYVNSNFINTYNVSSYSIGSGTTAMIGNYLPDPSRNFNGYICGLRVYNRVLTQEEIILLSKEFKI